MSEEIKPGHVLARVELLNGEIELLRQEMGRPKDERAEISVSGAAPREVYFEALAVFRKADRFSFERIGSQGVLPHPPAAAEIQPTHVRTVVDAALSCVRAVKARMNVPETVSEPSVRGDAEPSDVLGALTGVSRQLNCLLDNPFVPDDVFQQVTLALGYAAPILSKVEPSARPGLPDLERKKRPADVYRRLWDGYSTLRGVLTALDLQCAELGDVPYSDDEIEPSDVYDLASLLVSELVYLHSQVPGATPPSAAEFYEVERRLPSHVFQYAGQLRAYLDALHTAASADAGLFRS
jgi:hypothetical protein